mmetsp:Transcript_8855/g.24536  ORF Transcript_8855/g.24536 Transcript_8855/m.24536 type:complete len:412 (+) Transcript_8855:122-1357(+)
MTDTEQIISYGNPNVDRYECQQAVLQNTASDGTVLLANLTVSYGYELKYACTSDATAAGNVAIADIEEELLLNAKQRFLNSASVCARPQQYWFAAIDSYPPDFPASGVSCSNFNLQTGECCTVVQGNLTFVELSMVNQTEMEQWTETQFTNVQSDTPANWYGSTYQTYYLGNHSGHVEVVQTGAVSSIVGDNAATASPQDSEFTWMSILLLCFCIVCLLVVLGFMYERRRRKNKDTQLVKTLDDDQLWIEPRSLPNGDLALTKVPNRELQVHVVGDEMEDYLNNIEVASLASTPFQDTSAASDKYDYSLVSPDTTASPQRRYEWQNEQVEKEAVGGRKAQVLTYPAKYDSRQPPPTNSQQRAQHHQQGGGGFAVVAFDGEVSTDNASEVDSWAQSQGCSIGSLEQHEYGCN